MSAAMDLAMRIMKKVILEENGCWTKEGWNSGNGYGKVSVEGMTKMAHRAMYQSVVGPIPRGMVLDHLCRNRACCNPDHLEPVTHQVNTHRGDAVLIKGAAT